LKLDSSLEALEKMRETSQQENNSSQAELEGHMKNFSEQIEELEGQISLLNQEKDDLKSKQLNSLEVEEKMREALDKKENEVHTLQERCLACAASLEEVRSQIKKASEDSYNLREALRLEKESGRLREENSEILRARCEEFTKRLVDVEQHYESLCEQKDNQLLEAEKCVVQLKDAECKLQSDLSEMEYKIVLLNEETEKLQNSLFKVSTQIEGAEKVTGTLLGTIEAYTELSNDHKQRPGTENADLTEKLNGFLSQICSLVERMDTLAIEKEKDFDTIEMLREQRDSGEKEHAEYALTLQQEIRDCRESLRIAQCNKQLYQDEIKEVQAETNRLSTAVSFSQGGNNAALEQTEASLKERILQLRNELNSLEDEKKRTTGSSFQSRKEPVGASGGGYDNSTEVKKMSEKIKELGGALRESESLRADALLRLHKERLMNADTMRNLSENIRRFYASVQTNSL